MEIQHKVLGEWFNTVSNNALRPHVEAMLKHMDGGTVTAVWPSGTTYEFRANPTTYVTTYKLYESSSKNALVRGEVTVRCNTEYDGAATAREVLKECGLEVLSTHVE